MKKPLLVVLAALPLAACLSFGAKPPPSLLTITATATVPVGPSQTSGSSSPLSILVPTVPQSLATARVPVQTSPTDIQYLKDAQWVEPPQRLFARLMSDTVTARTGRIVLSPGQSISDPGTRLTGELRNFGIDMQTTDAVVTFDAALIRAEGQAIEKRRFEARVALAEITPSAAGIGLNQAANQVAGEVADWIGR